MIHADKVILLILLSAVTVVARIHYPEEHHLSNIRQLTFGGQNAEGYFSFDGSWLTFQASGIPEYGTSCDQIYKLDLTIPPNKQIPKRISTGEVCLEANTVVFNLGIGVCTCSYFYPDNLHLIYASTFQQAKFNSSDIAQSCPTKTCQTERAKTDPLLKQLCNTTYTWDLFPEYDIFKVNEFGSFVSRLTDTPGYDAEGAVSPDGKYIVFTSIRSGDPEIWIMNSDGTEPKQLTSELGYDGGPFFSPDGTKIVFRASRPKTAEEIKKYKDLLSYNLVSPLEMELYTININGSGLRKITSLGGSNWAPFYMPDNRRIIFSSNFNETGGHFGAFNLYIVDEMGQNIERVTFNEGGFDAFPMFDRSGRHLIWSSSRNGRSRTDLNIFIGDWTEIHKSIENSLKKKSIKSDHTFHSVLQKRNDPSKAQQLTFHDINIVSSFSMNDKRIIYEGYGNNFYGAACEQIFDLDLTNVSRRIRRLSTGLGAARSPIFISDYDALYSSNIVTADRSVLNSCPRGACTRVKQPWAKKICKKSLVLDLYPDFEIIKVNKFGNFVRRLTDTSGYHGDISLSPDKKKMVFTSTRRGDANLWIMNIDGGNLKQITDILGYEGGAKFSLDGKFIVFHASRPKSRTERAHYGLLLNQYHAVELRDTQIFLMNSDGTNISQLTTGNTNLWPQFISSEKILFARNSVAKKKMFNIFLINVDGSGLKQITADDDYTNVYPVTSHDRTKLLWSRNEAESKDMNLFLTDLHPFNSMPDSFNFFFIFELFPTNLLANALSFITDKLFT